MFHREVTGTPSSNLDLFLLGEETVRALFEKNTRGKDIAVIEGVMGLYDGLGASSSEASTWDTARVTGTPVVLVEDCAASALSAAARIYGMTRFRADSMVRAVILNNCGEALFAELKPAIEKETGVKVCGWLPRLKDCRIESRHLGLVTAEEIRDLHEKIAVLAAQFEKSVDIDGLLELANIGNGGRGTGNGERDMQVKRSTGVSPGSAAGVQSETSAPPEVQVKIPIAVARDKAFCFYYEDALAMLRELGADLLFFSPLAAERLPSGTKGLYLGGGYPELYAQTLSENKTLRSEIREAIGDGLPCIAECGGFMYLHETLVDGAGEARPMCGVLPGRCRKTPRLVRFGYASYTALEDNLLCRAGEVLRGHEFHYWESDNPGGSFTACKAVPGPAWRAIAARGNLFAGFPHFHFCGNPQAAERFLARCKDYGA
jgi:cobyrinic acid a,c-diamide synthase